MGKKPYVISTFSGEKGELPSARLVGSSGGGGGGGSVTPASIVTATEQMNDAQKSQICGNLGAISMGEMENTIADAVARIIVPMTVDSGNLVLDLERWGGIQNFVRNYVAGLNAVFALPALYLDQTAAGNDVLAMQLMGIDQENGVVHFEGVRGGKRYYAMMTPINANVVSGPLVIRDELPSVTAADLDDSFKDALLDCFANVAWATEDGQQYYDALEGALYPPNYIMAVYTQSGTVYDTDSLDNLKTDLVVTAFYQGGGSKTVTGYTLSGTLEVGISTITVSYAGKTTTFGVVVTAQTETVVDGTTLTWERGYIDASGNISLDSFAVGGYTSDYYDVSGFQTALVALDGSSVQRNAYYDSNKAFISRALTAESEIPNGAVYARASIVKGSLENTGYDGTGTTITLSMT